MEHGSWDDLKLFLALVRGGSMRAGAEGAGVSHSTLARRLAQLEARSGAVLLHRGPQGMSLTEAGQDVLRAAERVEEEILSVERRSFGKDTALRGPVVLTTIDALAVEPVMAVLRQFCERHPQIELRLDVNLSQVSLERREADLALRFGQPSRDMLVGRRLMKTGRAVYATSDYLARHWPASQPPTARWIGFGLPGQPEDWKKESPFPHFPTGVRMTDMRAQLAAAKAGLGIAWLPCFLADADAKLLRISEVDQPAFQELWLLRHADARGNARVRALSDHLLQAMANLGPLLRGETKPLAKLPTDGHPGTMDVQ